MRIEEIHHMTVYMCEPRLERILCGVYDAWPDPADHENIRLTVRGEYEELEFFTEYRDVQICPRKAEKVIRSACAKLSQKIYRKVYTAPLSQDRGRADRIYRFLIQTFRHDPSVLDIFQLPTCYDMFGLCRNICNENHLLIGFLRFSETPGGILVSRIGLENDIMILLAPHFADRLPEESWVIYDGSRKRAMIHPIGHSWFLINQPPEPEQENSDRGRSRWLRERMDEETYRGMWRMFRDTIAIRERRSPVCQKTRSPLRFRSYMTEFQK